MFLLKDDKKYGADLIKLGFHPNTCTSIEDDKQLLKYCKENHMKFLKGSYGTIVTNEFEKYFRYSIIENEDDMKFVNLELRKDHTNLLKNDEFNVRGLTSSPYNPLTLEEIINCPYDIYFIHPHFLNYYGFLSVDLDLSPYCNMNYFITDSDGCDILSLSQKIRKDLKLAPVFQPFKLNEECFDG